jgi:amino acid transporter
MGADESTSLLPVEDEHSQSSGIVRTFEPMSLEYKHANQAEGDFRYLEIATTAKPQEAPDTLLPLAEPLESPTVEAHQKRLGVVPLAVIIFYSVSGGPFGCEASVRAGGNFYTLLGFLVMPWVWSVQEALITAELGTAFPEASGGVAWVEEAFGPSAGWMSGYLSWVAGATDNAIYPVLFSDYVLAMQSDSEEVNPVSRFLLLSGTSLALGYINWLGLPLVGAMSVWICIVAMSPFLIMTVVGAFQIEPSRWLELPQRDPTSNDTGTDTGDDDDTSGGFFPNASLGGVLLRPFFNNLFWNLNSFDSASSFAADIDNPGRVLPRAMMWSVLLVVSCYLFPLMIAIGATDTNQRDWVDGYLASITSEIAGPWLGAWTVFAAGISNVGQFQAELSSDAFQLMGMADRGYLPKLFSIRSKHGTPTYGILLGTVVVVFLGVSDLATLIELLNFNYSISLLMEYCAFIKLRISRPDLERPFRIPLDTTGCILMLVPTFLLTLLVLGLATYQTYLFSVIVIIVGSFIFRGRQQSQATRTDTDHESALLREDTTSTD